MNARLTALLPASAFFGFSGLASWKNSHAAADRNAGDSEAPVLVPLWVAMGIAGAAALLPFYGAALWALPALVFLVACPLLVACMVLMEGSSARAD